MSEVNRYRFKGAAGEYVYAADFDNASRLFLDATERCIAAERREQALLSSVEHANAVRARLQNEVIALQRLLSAADERVNVLTRDLAIESAIKEPMGEDVLWQVLDAAVGVLTRRAAPHAWESEAHQAGLKIILARRAGLSKTLKPAEVGGDEN